MSDIVKGLLGLLGVLFALNLYMSWTGIEGYKESRMGLQEQVLLFCHYREQYRLPNLLTSNQIPVKHKPFSCQYSYKLGNVPNRDIVIHDNSEQCS